MPGRRRPIRGTERICALGRCTRAIATASCAPIAPLVLSAAWSAAQTRSMERMYRVGLLTASGESVEALHQGFRDLGYVEGRNLVLDVRDSEGRPERIDELAAQLVRAKADVIVAINPPAVLASRRATASIPIVMIHTPDPVQLGLVARLPHPGGNITGMTTLSVDLSIKQLELLRDAIPNVSRMALLWNPDNPWHPFVGKPLQVERRPAGVQLQILEVRRPDDFDKAFETMVKTRVQAVLVLADVMTFTHRSRLASLAIKHHLPLMAGPRGYTAAGGLLSYWADEGDLARRGASYVDRILKGASPAGLPIEQPTKYDLVVNLKTARALAVTLPPALLLRATVIE